MKYIQQLLTASLLLSMTTTAYAVCGYTTLVWSGDNDGSVRLSYNKNDGLEVIYREEEGVIISRGIIGKGHDRREIYAIYDLSNNTLSYAKSRYSPNKEQLDNQFSNIFFVQASHTFKVFTADKGIDAEIKAALAENREKACYEEVKKRWQGRTFDMEKCGNNAKAMQKIAMILALPDKAAFTELSENVQAQRFIDKFRKRDCDSVQDVGMKIISEFRKPETLKKLAYKKKMPAYLEEGKGIVEVETVERRYY